MGTNTIFTTVLSYSFAGFTFGATPNAKLLTLNKRCGAAPLAFNVLTLVSVFFTDLANAFIIKLFVGTGILSSINIKGNGQMNILIKILIAGIVIFGFNVSNSAQHYAYASGENQRYQECKQLRQSGQLRWYSIASGTISDGGGRNGYSGFHTKACHTNENSCRNWIRRIGYEISNLDSINTAYCKPVN